MKPIYKILISLTIVILSGFLINKVDYPTIPAIIFCVSGFSFLYFTLTTIMNNRK